MASGTRFEYSHETHTCRIPEAVTRAKFCQSIIDTKNKYGLSLMVPVLLNLYAQVWKPSAFTDVDYWAGGNAIIFNNVLYPDEIGGKKAGIFAVVDLITYNNVMDRYKLRILWGEKEDFSDVGFSWVKG